MTTNTKLFLVVAAVAAVVGVVWWRQRAPKTPRARRPLAPTAGGSVRIEPTPTVDWNNPRPAGVPPDWELNVGWDGKPVWLPSGAMV